MDPVQIETFVNGLFDFLKSKSKSVIITAAIDTVEHLVDSYLPEIVAAQAQGKKK